MGDTAVDFFLETLNQFIKSSNLYFVRYKKDLLQSLEKEIRYLREFLKNTEKTRNEYSEVMDLVKRIRDVVSEAENIVELILSHEWKERGSTMFVSHEPKKENIVKPTMFVSRKAQMKKMKMREKALAQKKKRTKFSLELESVRKEIQTLTTEVKKIYNESMNDINGVAVKKLKQSSSENGGGGSSSSRGKNTSQVLEEKVVVGFKDEVKTVMEKLHDNGEGGQLEIISIIGAGGGGKTTLARQVYDHPLTLHKFEIRAWATVSQEYNKTMKRDLLISILESASQRVDRESNEDELGEMVHKCLKGRKYLIVMDDIWDIEAWNGIQRSFPRDRKWSKVMFTSRQPVQSDSICCVPHTLAALSNSCSWELLENKVFGKQQCPPELVDIGKRIAEKCKGLPLAVVAIAGILATKDKTLDVWEKVAEHLSSIIGESQEGCMEILELSYNHLPLYLKACFLYIGGHEEDSLIFVRELMWLWIAEGFIQQNEEGKSLEAIAEDYLVELIDRNLIMVASKRKHPDKIEACRIHDLLRELCLQKAEEDNFLVQSYGDGSFSPSATNKHRRLFIGKKFFDELPPKPRAQNLRSFLCFPSNRPQHDQNLSFFVENFKLLRVLHSPYVVTQGEIGIGGLVHLRYLALTFPGGGPIFFHYLSNLETLIVNIFERHEILLPRDIIKMVKLRHLYSMEGIFKYHYIPNDENEGHMMDSLQTLNSICFCRHCVSFLERTPNLRKLALCGSGHNYDSCSTDLEFLKCLEKLYVGNVRVLRLKLPSTLTQLVLGGTYMRSEELSIILQALPRLEVLKLLYGAYEGRVWNTTKLEEGFPQLKYLTLQSLAIKQWKASDDQFPRLEVLVISSCHELKKPPKDLADLNELREIEIEYCNPCIEEWAREIQEKLRYRKGDDDCIKITTRGNTWDKTCEDNDTEDPSSDESESGDDE